jgi:hypothetical protein
MAIKTINGNDVFETSRYNEEMYDEMYEVSEGIALMNADYRNNDITLDNDMLYIGEHIVYEGGDRMFNPQSVGGRVPSMYIIRTFNGKYWEFECGFDLLEDEIDGALYWTNGNRFKTIAECFDYLELKYGEFRIFVEEPMRF